MSAQQIEYAFILVYRNKLSLPLALYFAEHTTEADRATHITYFNAAR
jgi:hypothetical protein